MLNGYFLSPDAWRQRSAAVPPLAGFGRALVRHFKAWEALASWEALGRPLGGPWEALGRPLGGPWVGGIILIKFLCFWLHQVSRL